MSALPVVGAATIGSWRSCSAGSRVAEVELRPTLLALSLAAGGVLGVLVARTWFPRLAGLVSISALFSLVLIGRALLA